MERLCFSFVCPNCESRVVAHLTRVEQDDTITCLCGYGFSQDGSQRAEREIVLTERCEEIAEIHSAIVISTHGKE